MARSKERRSRQKRVENLHQDESRKGIKAAKHLRRLGIEPSHRPLRRYRHLLRSRQIPPM